MSIKLKTTLIITFFALLLSIVLYFFSKTFLLTSFENLERNYTIQKAVIVKDIFNNCLDYVTSLSYDLANWKETYNFLTKKNTNLPEYKFLPENHTLENLNLNFFVIFDKNGNPVFFRGFDLINKKSVEIDEKFLTSLKYIISYRKRNSGYFKTNNHIVILSISDIKNPDTKQKEGLIVIGKFLTKELALKLTSDIFDKIYFSKLDINPKYQLKVDDKNICLIEPKDKSIIISYYTEDITGKKINLLNGEIDRNIYLTGLLTIEQFGVAILFALILIVAGFIISLNKFILSPISNLERILREKISKKDLSFRFKTNRKDEIGNFLISVNTFLDTIQSLTQELKNRDEIFTTISETSPVAIYMYQDGHFIYINKAAEQITGYTLKEIEKMSPFQIIFPEDVEKIKEIYKKREKGEKFISSYHLRIVRKDGEIRHLLVTSNTVIYNNKPAGIGIVIDITEMKELQKQLTFIGTHDNLTGLYNRTFFFEQLKELIEISKDSNKYISVLYIDLNRFKEIINSYGHKIGDIILKEIAERIKSSVKRGDIVSRLSGDEFGIISPNIKEIDDASKIAERIIYKLEKPFNIDGKIIYLTTSVGISVFPVDGKDADSLVRNAQIAMYHAKKTSKKIGKSKFEFYSEELGKIAKERIKIKNLLKYAIENKKDEFMLYYQPIINLQKMKLEGVEALIRWKSSELGLVESEKFIEIAEKSGLIVKLGNMIIEKAITQMKEWYQEGKYDFHLSINISSEQFRSKDFLQSLQELTKDCQCKNKIIFEITETLLVEDVNKAKSIINKIKDMGFKISIDDFGTGYSSLNYLKEFPFDILKIDKSFLDDILENQKSRAIVLSIIELSHNLGALSLSEGIETKEQLELLKEMGCDLGQGYYFSVPLSKEEIQDYLEKNIF